MPEAPNLFSVEDACRNLCISNSYFYLLVKRGVITPVKLGRRTLVPRAEIERLTGGQPANNSGLKPTDVASLNATEHTHTDI